MDGKYVSLGVSGAYDAETLPYLCNAGCYGNLTKPMKQNTGTCTGLCPAGNYCPTPGTVDPIICPAGSWCPEGSILPRVCDAGYFSNQTGDLPPPPLHRPRSLPRRLLPSPPSSTLPSLPTVAQATRNVTSAIHARLASTARSAARTPRRVTRSVQRPQPEPDVLLLQGVPQGILLSARDGKPVRVALSGQHVPGRGWCA